LSSCTSHPAQDTGTAPLRPGRWRLHSSCTSVHTTGRVTPAADIFALVHALRLCWILFPKRSQTEVLCLLPLLHCPISPRPHAHDLRLSTKLRRRDPVLYASLPGRVASGMIPGFTSLFFYRRAFHMHVSWAHGRLRNHRNFPSSEYNALRKSGRYRTVCYR
jgi:hypothetical protein